MDLSNIKYNYKIRVKETGYYLSGNRKKTWMIAGAVRNKLNDELKYNGRTPDELEVCLIPLDEMEAVSVPDFLKALEERDNKSVKPKVRQHGVEAFEFQKKVRSSYYFAGETPREELLYLALAMNTEAGEAGDEIKKMMRDDGGELTPDRLDKIKCEMGDTLFYMSILADKLGFTFSDAFKSELNKLEKHVRKDAR